MFSSFTYPTPIVISQAHSNFQSRSNTNGMISYREVNDKDQIIGNLKKSVQLFFKHNQVYLFTKQQPIIQLISEFLPFYCISTRIIIYHKIFCSKIILNHHITNYIMKFQAYVRVQH